MHEDGAWRALLRDERGRDRKREKVATVRHDGQRALIARQGGR